MDKLFRWIKDNPASSVLRTLTTVVIGGACTIISIATDGIFLLVVFGAAATIGIIIVFFMLIDAADREKYNRASLKSKD